LLFFQPREWDSRFFSHVNFLHAIKRIILVALDSEKVLF
jgi:hypothetical protein